MIFCEHPHYIWNKSLGNLNKRRDLVKLYNGKPVRMVYKSEVNESNYHLYEILDTNTGELYPMFMEVPCGHCLLCQKRRKESIVRRMKYEAQTCQGYIYFVTLTYDDNHLDDALAYSHIQKYVKRVRIHLERHHNFTNNFGWFVSSEHGVHRPHWHMMFFGMPTLNYMQRAATFLNHWNYGSIKEAVCLNGDEDVAKTIGYVSKYCVKSAVSGYDDEIQKWSQGLGSTLIKSKQSFVYTNENAKHLKYYDYNIGDTKDMIIDKATLYYLFDKGYYTTYLKSRRWLEQYATKSYQNVIDMCIEENILMPEYAPVLHNTGDMTLPGTNYAQKMLENLIQYSERKRKERLFISNNIKQIDPVTFKEIRNLRLHKIREDIVRYRELEKI